MATKHTILVVGATGQQGGAVVDALLALPSQTPPLHILALTRNAQSPKAQSVAAKSPKDEDSRATTTIEVVQGDATKPESIFASRPAGSISSLFIVTVPPSQGGKSSEESQAIPLIDAAVAHGVKHIVFSSVDRGGDEKSWTNPCTDIPHFLAKHNIEVHLRDKAAAAVTDNKQFAYTILRPTAFLDNLNPGFFCAIFAAMWASALSPSTTKLQLVSTHDIGVFAARALTDEDQSVWKDKALGLAGDSLTLDEVKEVFQRVEGKKLPQTFTFLGGAMLWGVKELGTMFEFFEKEGYGADIERLRKVNPGLQSFEKWLTESSKWKDQ